MDSPARALKGQQVCARHAGAVVVPVQEPCQEPSPSNSKVAPEVFGVSLTLDILVVGFVYIAQGALGLVALAKPYFLKDELHLSPGEASVLLSLTYWPWALKPLYGFIADAYPIFGSRRHAYLITTGLVSAVGWSGLAMNASSLSGMALLFMCLGNLGVAFSDVVVDCLVVERAQDNSRLMEVFQSYSWGCRGIGAVLSAYFSGALLETWGSGHIFAVTAVLPVLVACAAMLIKEDTTGMQAPPAVDDIMRQVSLLWDSVRSPEILQPLIVITLWQMTPSTSSAMFYYYTNDLHFNPEFLGRSQLIGALASLSGIFFYKRFFAAMPARDYLHRVKIAAVVVGLLPLLLVTRANLAFGIPDRAFVLGDDVIQTLAGELAHMSILVLAGQICPPGFEATLFALLMCVLNLTGIISSMMEASLMSMLGVTATDFSNLPLLLFICNACSLLPLFLLRYVKAPKATPCEEPGMTVQGA